MQLTFGLSCLSVIRDECRFLWSSQYTDLFLFSLCYICLPSIITVCNWLIETTHATFSHCIRTVYHVHFYGRMNILECGLRRTKKNLVRWLKVWVHEYTFHMDAHIRKVLARVTGLEFYSSLSLGYLIQVNVCFPCMHLHTRRWLYLYRDSFTQSSLGYVK